MQLLRILSNTISVFLLGSATTLGACSSQRDDAATASATAGPGLNPSGTGTATATGSPGADPTAPILDVGTPSETEGSADSVGEGCPPLTGTDAIVRGTVYAPNQEIPVSGALVYLIDERPEGIPQLVYCADCVELQCGAAFALTEADGSFEFPAFSGTQYLAVQKGQFLRITEITVAEGDNNAFGAELTSLPDRNAPSEGLYIPRIALAWGAYDRLEDALGKLGLADTVINGTMFTQDFVPGSEEFDVWDNSGVGTETDELGTFSQLLGAYPLLEQYHIIFVPCSNDAELAALDVPQNRENLQRWVENGGKFYVSDWSNEFVARAFPQYQTFFTNSGGSADLGVYDSTATILDDELTAWLDALPANLKDINPLNGGGAGHPTVANPPTIETVENWSGIDATPSVLVDDGMGGQVDVGHKIWIEGPASNGDIPGGNHPLTVTAPYGCGKVLFTTYHMAEFDDSYVGLTPQELVLLYLILEIGVCQTNYEPPPPVG